MTRSRRLLLAVTCVALACAAALALRAFRQPAKSGGAPLADVLADSISRITAACPGEVGVAVLVGGTDTVVVNDWSVYPMMSVFKLHQALALCNRFDRDGRSLDTLLTIRRDELDPHTWSPMLKEHREALIALPVADLLRYTLVWSDNNASNVLFERLQGVAATDSFVATLIPRASFQIAYTEAEMSVDHAKAYSNYTSPLGAAMLMDRLFADSIVSRPKQRFIQRLLGECTTGKDRIAAPLLDKAGVTIAHKTGSGYTANGILTAHNDVAHICLPSGVRYTLAVFIKDFRGYEAQASRVAARISAAVYAVLAEKGRGS